MADFRASETRSPRPRRRARVLDELALRISYISLEGDESDVGALETNLITHFRPHTQQAAPFTVWFPSPKVGLAPPAGPLWRTLRSQRNWLAKYRPEASVWDASLNSLLSEGISLLGDAPETPRSAQLLAVGEIIDKRLARPLQPTPLVAFASGDHGHTLRLATLAEEEWHWTAESLTVGLFVPAREDGEWTNDEMPITAIRAFHHKDAKKRLRWFIVQKDTSTTILEPRLRMIPYQDPDDTTRHGTHWIFPNPICSISMDMTGNAPHSDFAFNPPSYGKLPQLAIVDRSGHWSIWNVTGHSSGDNVRDYPVLTARGNFPGKVPTSAALDCPGRHNRYRLLWLLKEGALKTGDDEEGDPLSPNQYHWEPARTFNSERSSTLVVSDGRSLWLLDSTNSTVTPVLRLIPVRKPYHILDIQQSLCEPQQLFVLTNQKIYWIAMDTGTKPFKLKILMSCLHQRDRADETLTMALSNFTDVKGNKSCVSSVRSAQDNILTTVWFRVQVKDRSYQYWLQETTIKSGPGCSSMAVVPLTRKYEIHEGSAGTGPHRFARYTRFFQYLFLGLDLSLGASLHAVSELGRQNHELPPPDKRRSPGTSRAKERNRILSYLGDVFAVPDRFDERTVLQDMRALTQDDLVVPRGTKKASRSVNIRIELSETPSDHSGIMDDEMASGAQAGSPEPESEESHVDSALQFLEDSTIERARDWELEGDATQLLWTCRESQKNEEAAAQIRRRNEARRRKAEQRLALLRPSGAQQLQPAFLSSPPRAASPRQTRTQSQGSGPSDLPVFSQPMSQVVPGVFGGRPPIAKRRKIRRETRSQGFR